MSCEICGRNSCSRCFHSSEEIETFDNNADLVKDRMRNILKSRINRLSSEIINEAEFIKLNDVIEIIDNY